MRQFIMIDCRFLENLRHSVLKPFQGKFLFEFLFPCFTHSLAKFRMIYQIGYFSANTEGCCLSIT